MKHGTKKPVSPHMQDFREPWRHFKYVPGEKLVPDLEMLPYGEYGDGCMLNVSSHMVLYADYACNDAKGDIWTGKAMLVQDRKMTPMATCTVLVSNNENASVKILNAVWESMLPAVQELREGIRNMYYHMQKASGMPEEPTPVKPAPDIWYPADKYVPDDDRPVIVAWTDFFGLEHGGDQTAIYKDGEWHWAFGDQDPVSDRVQITDWTICPEGPDYP